MSWMEAEVGPSARETAPTPESQKNDCLAGALLLGHRSSHQRGDELTAAVGVTGPYVPLPCVAASTPHLYPHPARRPASVIGSTLTFVELGGNHADRRSAGRRGCYELCRSVPGDPSGPFHERLTASAPPYVSGD